MESRATSPPAAAVPEPAAPPETESDEVIRHFVEHWGLMARSWGINATMGELFALLYITQRDWTAEELRRRLNISRGNASMNLRELMSWGVVHRVHRAGERREFYRAEADVWTLFRRILNERKRRELDPTLLVLDRTAARTAADPDLKAIHGRVVALQRFFSLVDVMANRLSALQPDDLDSLQALLGRTAFDA